MRRLNAAYLGRAAIRLARGTPGGILRRNDDVLTSMRRNDVASASVRRHFGIMCPQEYLTILS